MSFFTSELNAGYWPIQLTRARIVTTANDKRKFEDPAYHSEQGFHSASQTRVAVFQIIFASIFAFRMSTRVFDLKVAAS